MLLQQTVLAVANVVYTMLDTKYTGVRDVRTSNKDIRLNGLGIQFSRRGSPGAHNRMHAAVVLENKVR